MKQLLIVLIAIVAAVKLWFWFQEKRSAQALSMDFSSPVYAQVRGSVAVGGRRIQEVDLIKTANKQDCERAIEVVEALLERARKESNLPIKVDSKSCDSSLPRHLARTFDNVPTETTYLSVARGAPDERELRIVYWGVTAKESDAVCSFAASLAKDHKGAVTCIRANR
jgi:hypothetical protein